MSHSHSHFPLLLPLLLFFILFFHASSLSQVHGVEGNIGKGDKEEEDEAMMTLRKDYPTSNPSPRLSASYKHGPIEHQSSLPDNQRQQYHHESYPSMGVTLHDQGRKPWSGSPLSSMVSSHAPSSPLPFTLLPWRFFILFN